MFKGYILSMSRKRGKNI